MRLDVFLSLVWIPREKRTRAFYLFLKFKPPLRIKVKLDSLFQILRQELTPPNAYLFRLHIHYSKKKKQEERKKEEEKFFSLMSRNNTYYN